MTLVLQWPIPIVKNHPATGETPNTNGAVRRPQDAQQSERDAHALTMISADRVRRPSGRKCDPPRAVDNFREDRRRPREHRTENKSEEELGCQRCTFSRLHSNAGMISRAKKFIPSSGGIGCMILKCVTPAARHRQIRFAQCSTDPKGPPAEQHRVGGTAKSMLHYSAYKSLHFVTSWGKPARQLVETAIGMSACMSHNCMHTARSGGFEYMSQQSASSAASCRVASKLPGTHIEYEVLQRSRAQDKRCRSRKKCP